MKELYVFCEGQTEQGFCTEVLAKHLFPDCVGCIHTIKVANARNRGIVSRGGLLQYAPLRRDIINTLKSRNGADIYFTTLIDLYGLPGDFPGKSECTRNPSDPTPYVVALEAAFKADIGDARFIPYLQLHEYETILYADPRAFAISFENCDAAVAKLEAIVADHPTIEHINDSRNTAPSKRIISLIPAYEGLKASAGPDIASYIGINTIRAKCPHFDQWLTILEHLKT